MTRGGRRKNRDEPERRCAVSGESGPTEGLIRFALDPESRVVPDLAERLPGRGIWVTSTREALETAVKRNAFARAAKAPVKADPGLPDLVERLLAARLRDAIALARKAGLAVTGHEKVKARLKEGPVGALVQARDGSRRELAKLRPLAGDAEIVSCLDSDDLGLAFGRDFVIHAALDEGGVTERVLREAKRLSGFRPCGETPNRTTPASGGTKDG